MTEDSVNLNTRAKHGMWLEWKSVAFWVLQSLKMKVKFFNKFKQHTRNLGSYYLHLDGSFLVSRLPMLGS